MGGSQSPSSLEGAPRRRLYLVVVAWADPCRSVPHRASADIDGHQRPRRVPAQGSERRS